MILRLILRIKTDQRGHPQKAISAHFRKEFHRRHGRGRRNMDRCARLQPPGARGPGLAPPCQSEV
jgi:hypothetical protein